MLSLNHQFQMLEELRFLLQVNVLEQVHFDRRTYNWSYLDQTCTDEVKYFRGEEGGGGRLKFLKAGAL